MTLRQLPGALQRNVCAGPDSWSQVGPGKHQQENSPEHLREHRGHGGTHACMVPDPDPQWCSTGTQVGIPRNSLAHVGPRGNVYGA